MSATVMQVRQQHYTAVDNKGMPAFSENSVYLVFSEGNLKRRLGRARGFVLRMFDALCNCTQTAAAAARTTARNNPFTKR
ncbi:unnamed protein product [Plutella xylostella]|uniref:(diamondback moth) hypothetical protein n=1 Tax=Plutella xylostella TaxID=51655 RepID=A0A8S4D4Y2_PLUXY|nr:unnamed protein product [Plutella xylostella]